jgi:hypothetical protein
MKKDPSIARHRIIGRHRASSESAVVYIQFLSDSQTSLLPQERAFCRDGKEHKLSDNGALSIFLTKKA